MHKRAPLTILGNKRVTVAEIRVGAMVRRRKTIPNPA